MERKKIFMLLALAGMCLNFTGFEKSKDIWRKGDYNYVRIVKADKTLKNLDQPKELSPELLKNILLSIRYQRAVVNIPGNLGKPKEFDLFLADELEQIAGYLADAFKQAGPEQMVDFSIVCKRGQFLIGERVSDGYGFIEKGRLNLAFRSIAEKLGADQNINTSNPLKLYSGSSKLIAGEGQELAKDKKAKPKANWLIIDLEFYQAQASKLEEKKIKAEDKKVEQIESAPEKGKSVKERLLELKELYEQGLITEQEYNKKREEILKEL